MNAEAKICSNGVLGLIEKIGSISSKNVKIAMIEENWHHPMFKFAVVKALDPFVTYGIAKMPKVDVACTEGRFTPATVKLLSDLEERRLTGNAAQDALISHLESLGEPSQDLLGRIITGKLKGGFTESSVNKAVPGAIYTFKAMLSHKLSDRFGKKDFTLPMKAGQQLEDPWAAELKEDGVRGFGRSTMNGQFCSRSGKPLNAGETLEAEVMTLFSLWASHWGYDEPLVVDGELDEIGGVFNDTVGSVHRKDGSDQMGLKVIDVITQAELDAGECPIVYCKRRAQLEAFFEEYGHKFERIRLVKMWPIHSVEEAMALFARVHADGEEGIIVKRPDGIWEGKRSTAWLKVKGEETVDLVVKRIEAGTEGDRFEHCMGNAWCDYTNSKGEVVEVSIGGGWSEDQRKYFWENQSELIGRLIEVEYHEETQDGSLRHPRFKRFRDDKPVSDGQGK